MNKNIVVIVMPHPGVRRLIETPFDNLSLAKDEAEILKGEGVCVIVRNNYNENDDITGRQFFREWRSFNGEAFKECRWDI